MRRPAKHAPIGWLSPGLAFGLQNCKGILTKQDLQEMEMAWNTGVHRGIIYGYIISHLVSRETKEWKRR